MDATEAAVKADSQYESTVLWTSVRQGLDLLFELQFASMIKRKNKETVKDFGSIIECYFCTRGYSYMCYRGLVQAEYAC